MSPSIRRVYESSTRGTSDFFMQYTAPSHDLSMQLSFNEAAELNECSFRCSDNDTLSCNISAVTAAPAISYHGNTRGDIGDVRMAAAI